MAEALKPDELEQLGKVLAELEVKHKADSKQDLIQWMKEYVKMTEGTAVKSEPGTTSVDTADTTSSATTISSTSVTTTTTPGFLQAPRTDNFHGDTPPSKGDKPYEVWQYQVNGLLDASYPDHVVLHCVQRSLKGSAAKIAMRLGRSATVKDTLEKFKSVYGAVEAKECILPEFYSARQKDGEDVSNWGCRLDDIINKAVARGMVPPSEVNEKLTAMFKEGMREDLKDTIGHLFITIKDFDSLRIAIRELEYSKTKRQQETKKTTNKMTTVLEPSSEFKEIKGMIHQMQSELANMKSQIQGNGHTAGGFSRRNGQSSSSGGFTRGNGRPPYGQHRGGYRGTRSYEESIPLDYTDSITTCYRWGQEGYISKKCYNQPINQRGNLNSRRSTGRRGRL